MIGGVGEDQSLAAGLAFESRQVSPELRDVGAPRTGAVKQPGVAQVDPSFRLTAPNVQIVDTDLIAFLDSPDIKNFGEWGSIKKETRLESTGTSPGIWNLDFDLWTLDFFYELRMTQGYQLDHSLSQRLLKHFFDNVLFKNVGLIHVLPLAVHLFFLY